jgi:hypothetical protein
MKKLASLLVMTALSGCASMTTADFKGGAPQMRLEEYFNGDSTAYGMFFNRAGDVKRQFKVAMHGVWDGSKLILNEDFTYDDGEKQLRVWTFRKTGENTWEGTAPDVIGTATGAFEGNAYRMHYTADLKSGSSTYRLDFDDWLFRQSDNVVLNNAKVTKFGLDVGQIQLVFVRDRNRP